MPALTLTKIFDRIPKVLDLIVEDNALRGFTNM